MYDLTFLELDLKIGTLNIIITLQNVSIILLNSNRLEILVGKVCLRFTALLEVVPKPQYSYLRSRKQTKQLNISDLLSKIVPLPLYDQPVHFQ